MSKEKSNKSTKLKQFVTSIEKYFSLNKFNKKITVYKTNAEQKLNLKDLSSEELKLLTTFRKKYIQK